CLSPSQLEELRGIRNLTLSGGRGDLGEEQRVRLGAVRGVHRLERVHGALEVAQEETGVALEIVQIGVVGIDLEPLVRDLERCLGMAGLEEVLEQLLAQLLVGRGDPEHLLERDQRVGGIDPYNADLYDLKS